MGAGTIATLLGVSGHLVRGMGFGVIFWYPVNQNQVIYWTQGEGLFLCLISESLGKRWERGTTIEALLEHIERGVAPGINKNNYIRIY